MTLRAKLEALAVSECTGTDEYLDCAIHSAQSQAMAKALLTLITDEERWLGQNGDHAELMAELSMALDKAGEIK